jgi:hypothetical protein
MRLISVIAFLLVLTASGIGAEDTVMVRGEVTFTESGFARISECGTKRVYPFGVMASSPYFNLRRRYEELSAGGKKPVLIEAQGVLVRAAVPANGATLEHPKVISLAQGSCD